MFFLKALAACTTSNVSMVKSAADALKKHLRDEEANQAKEELRLKKLADKPFGL